MEKNESHKMNMNNFQEQITPKLPFVKTPLFYSLNAILAHIESVEIITYNLAATDVS